MTDTSQLGLPLLEPAQAQKHVTVNEALVRLDAPGAWDLRIDVRQDALRFVHAARMDVPADPVPEGAAK